MKKIVSFLLIAALVFSFIPLSASAVEITGISYTPADENSYTFYEGENAELRHDETHGGDYFYYVINFNVDDTLTVYFSDDSEKSYVAEIIDGELYFVNGDERIRQWRDITREENQQDEHWGLGEHSFDIVYNGFRTTLTATVIKNPVDSISYTPVDGVITRYFETGGYVDTDNEGHEYYYYNPIERRTDDVLTVSYNDGRGIVNYRLTYDPEPMYVSESDPGDFISERDVEMFEKQRDKHYTIGSDNCIYVSYLGHIAPITVDIILNPISEIVYTPVKPIEIFEYSNGEWYEDEGVQKFRYNTPWFKSGDVLRITYVDERGTVNYTYIDRYDSETDTNYRGFYTDTYEELPDRELYTTHSGDWQLGDDNFMCVEYMDNRSNAVQVTIKENPVKGIRYVPAEGVRYIEGTNMYHDYTDDADYYEIPRYRSGDKLIIIDKHDEETVYEYRNGEHGGAYVAEGKDDIPQDEVFIHHNQREHPWTLGENTYTVEYLGCSYDVVATVIENPVASIEFIPASPFILFENAGGHYDEELGYYLYFCGWISEGDKLVLTNKDDSVTEYEYMQHGENSWDFAFVAADGSVIENREITFPDSQSEQAWHAGDDNVMYIEYAGIRCSVNVTINENPVKAIKYTPAVQPSVMVGVRSHIEDGNEIFDLPYFNEGDTISVTDKNSVTKLYTARRDERFDIYFAANNGDTLDMSKLMLRSDQYIQPWALGDDNEYYVEYFGVGDAVKCVLLPNNVDSIEYIPLNPVTYIAGTKMHHDDWDDKDYYDRPYFSRGDKLIVYYSDLGRGRVEYTATYDEQLNRLVFLSADGDRILEDSRFDIYDEQYFHPWTVGVNYYFISYCGKTAQVPVTIIENNLAGISYTPVSMPQIWEGDYSIEPDKTGNTYRHYNLPDFRDGDILTVSYTNAPAKDFVLTFDERDGERYFVNGDERIHIYDLFRSDKQYENAWSLGKGNYYTVDLYGFTADVEVEIIDSDVVSISFTPSRDIVIDADIDGEYLLDENNERFYLYNRIRIINVGDQLTVTYKNGTVITYTLEVDPLNDAWHLRSANGDTLDTSEVNINDHQWENHWKPGVNYFEISYHGASDSVPVTVKAAYKAGDIDGNAEVDNRDLLLLFKHLTGHNDKVNESALDVNGDGVVNNKDFTRLFKYLSGWDVVIY